MARYRVVFTEPMIYQVDHPKARREVTELLVSSHSVRAAELHAIRTCTGPGDVLRVEEVEKVLSPPVVEIVPDPPPLVFQA